MPHARAHALLLQMVLLSSWVVLVRCGEGATAAPDASQVSVQSDAGAGALPDAGSTNTNVVLVEAGTVPRGDAGISACEILEAGPDCGYVLAPAGPACGDGKVEEGSEECDDANRIPGDGCSGMCTLEPNWACPPTGGACQPTIRCGDGLRGVGEACDDGNTAAGDGCAADCSRVEPGWYCPVVGAACSAIQSCGNGLIDTGELCDDANQVAQDGCNGSCQVEPGWRCVRAGQACQRVPVCGNLKVETGEQCDDGNSGAGDGCSEKCRIEASYYDCPATGGPCTSKVRCGDGQIEAAEQCDDGNAVDTDGCTVQCWLASGYVCRKPDNPCTPKCGDSMQVGDEQCDDGNTGSGDGCSSTCRVEPGYACPSVGACRPSACGDGTRDLGEACDDGNQRPFDGCQQCVLEPSCPGGVCQSVCGDGRKYDDEACDDGNTFANDGCSAACQLEPGYTCQDVPTPASASTKLPMLYRDFVGYYVNADNTTMQAARAQAGIAQHPDFNHFTAEGTLGMVEDQLGADGTPVYVTPNNPAAAHTTGSAAFYQWYHDDSTVNLVVPGELVLSPQADGSYVYDSALIKPYVETKFDPLNGAGLVGAGLEPSYCGTGSNLSFTSETHFWFEYQGGEQFAFNGDDDVWVFLDGRLVIDLGDLHHALEGSFTLDRAGTATATSTLAGSRTLALGLTLGHVYEISLFHAERQYCGSNFKITIRNFSKPKTTCEPICGDGVATTFEECDQGTVNSDTAYGGCTTDCVWGPFCGDGRVDAAHEACDDGRNTTIGYNMSGCGPGCRLPPRCGDGILDPGEECDAGTGNDGRYGGCTSECLLGPYCGDGITNGSEACDDGQNVGGYGLCQPGCVLGERCGDGQVQSGEECDDGASNGQTGHCTTDCGVAARCGDGVVQAVRGESCDDGVNNGSYGTCTADCQRAPYCGDGAKNGPEICDDGVNQGGYGRCAANCQLDEYCGDAEVNGPEGCDDGNLKNGDGCSASCALETVPA